MKKALIVYHYLALYRLPIFQELMQSSNVEYTIISGDTTEKVIKLINEEYKNKSLAEGGLRWKHTDNVWLLNKKFLWQRGLISEIFTGDYDSYIFLGSPYFLTSWIGAIIAKIKTKKVYYWMHGINKEKPNLVDYLKLFVFYKIADGFFLYGKGATRLLNKFKVKAAKDIHVIYNSLNYNTSVTLRKNLTSENIFNFRIATFADSTTPIVVFIGRLNATKKLNLLLQSQFILKEKYGKSYFNTIIVGDGEELDNLKGMTTNLGLAKNVKFKGAIYDEAINAEVLMHSDLCVTPGEVGLTAIHSLAYGTPTISHDNLNIQMPEVESIKPGINGDLFKHDDVASLAKSIENWLTLHPVKTAAIMSDCYQVIDQYYNPKYQAKIFNEVLSK